MNTPGASQNFSDPTIAATMAELARRWPAIGAAADHPLTEFFIQKRARLPWSRRGRNELLLRQAPYHGMLLLGVLAIYQMSPRFMGLIYLPLILGTALIRRYVRVSKMKDLRWPSDILLASDAGQLEQLRLTPLKWRDLLGLEIALEYCRLQALHRRLIHSAWALLVMSLMGGISGWVFTSLPPQIFEQVQLWPLSVMGAAFMLTVGWYVQLPVIRLELAIQRAERQLFEMRRRLFKGRGLMDWGLMHVLVLLVSIGMMIIIIGMRPGAAVALLLIELVLLGAITIMIWQGQFHAPRQLNEKFEAVAERSNEVFLEILAGGNEDKV